MKVIFTVEPYDRLQLEALSQRNDVKMQVVSANIAMLECS